MGLGLVCYTSSLPSNSCLTVFFFFIAFHSSSLLLYRHWMAIQKYFSKCQSISAGCKSRLPWQPKSYRQIYNFMSPTQYHAICSSQKSGVCHQLSLISAGLTGMGSLRMSRPWEPHGQICTLAKAGRRQHLVGGFLFPFLHSFPALFLQPKPHRSSFYLLLFFSRWLLSSS